MTGILCIDKPQGFTSFDVVAKARGITGCRKMGHGGTLDPMATGVLPLFLGRATKAMDLMPAHDKRYTASFRLGLCTDTQDITGTVLTTSDLPIPKTALETALTPLRGEIDQLPPMYSAVWVGGQRLYDLARQGLEVERPTRQVTIHRLELAAYNPEAREGVLEVSCSKGTYVRTLIHDLGVALGCGGTLTALRRTQTLGYSLDCCHTLAQLQAMADEHRVEQALLPVETAFADCPRLGLTATQARLLQSGVRLDTRRIPDCPAAEGRVTVWRETTFLATATIDKAENELILEKLFVLPEQTQERRHSV